MARAFLRETMIALRARRQAYRIATDFIYENPIDVETFPCRSCGQTVRVEAVTPAGLIRCTTCGVWNRAPAHLRSRRRPEFRALAGPAAWASTMEQARRRQRIAILLLAVLLVTFVAMFIAPHVHLK